VRCGEGCNLCVDEKPLFCALRFFFSERKRRVYKWVYLSIKRRLLKSQLHKFMNSFVRIAKFISHFHN